MAEKIKGPTVVRLDRLSAQVVERRDGRQERPENLPRSPVIGTDAPVQYEQREDVGQPRRRLPAR